MCLFLGFYFLKRHSLEKIFHPIALRFVWFEIYVFLHWNVNFEIAKIEEKKYQMHRMGHVAFWVVICEVLKSKLKMLFTSFEKMTFLFIVWCTYSVMHNGLEFFKKEHHYKRISYIVITSSVCFTNKIKIRKYLIKIHNYKFSETTS